jgi:predicted TIM-barrel fold metal-dependent hydrolase
MNTNNTGLEKKRFKIDADTHYVDPAAFKYIDKKYEHLVPKFELDKDDRLINVKIDQDPCPISFNRQPFALHNEFPGISNIQKRIDDFAKLKVDFQILNPQFHTIRFSQLTEPGLANQMAFSYNRTLLETIQKYPNHFAGPIMVPLQDIDFSIKELIWAKENGIGSVIIDMFWIDPNFPISLPVTETPNFEKFCKTCEDLNITISIHFAMHFINFYHFPTFLKLKLNKFFPKNIKLILMSFITSGLLDKFPKLKIIFNEGGMKFISEGYHNLISLNIKPSRYFKENFWFTTETEEEKELLSSIQLIGAERFLFATDYPHDDEGGLMKFSDVELFENLPLSEDEKNLISWANAKEVFLLNNIKI